MACRVSRMGRVVLVLVPIVGCEGPSAQTCGASDVQAGSAAAASGVWPNEPAGLRAVSEAPLGARNEEPWRCEGTGLSVATDPTAPAPARTALVFTYAPGFRSGYAPGVAYYGLPTPTKETYFGFWWKPSDPWQTHPSGVNKMALLFPITSAAGTVYIMMFYDGSKYTIQVETTFANDTRRLEPNVMPTPVTLGRWHQIEWYVRYSTTATSRDGVVRWWLDGVLQGVHTDLQMPGDLGVTEYTIRPVWGGAEGDAKTHTDSFSYGHVRISAR